MILHPRSQSQYFPLSPPLLHPTSLPRPPLRSAHSAGPLSCFWSPIKSVFTPLSNRLSWPWLLWKPAVPGTWAVPPGLVLVSTNPTQPNLVIHSVFCPCLWDLTLCFYCCLPCPINKAEFWTTLTRFLLCFYWFVAWTVNLNLVFDALPP